MRLEKTGEIPTPEQIKEARLAAGIKQAQACEMVHLKNTVRWSEYENGDRNMDAARWELFRIKVGQHSEFIRRKPAGRKTNEERAAMAEEAHDAAMDRLHRRPPDMKAKRAAAAATSAMAALHARS